MIGIEKKCPYCGHKQFIPVQVMEKDEKLTISEPYITCEMCMDEFKIELKFKAVKIA